MSKFTRGKWVVTPAMDNKGQVYILENNPTIINDKELRANANLMEEAPVMLEALKKSNPYLGQLISEYETTMDLYLKNDISVNNQKIRLERLNKQYDLNKTIIKKAENGKEK